MSSYGTLGVNKRSDAPPMLSRSQTEGRLPSSKFRIAHWGRVCRYVMRWAAVDTAADNCIYSNLAIGTQRLFQGAAEAYLDIMYVLQIDPLVLKRYLHPHVLPSRDTK